jgi:hypothetical protein
MTGCLLYLVGHCFFILSLFNDVINFYDYMSKDTIINEKLKRVCKEAAKVQFKIIVLHCLTILRKTMENISRNTQSPGQDLNWTSEHYVLTIR